MFTRQNLSWCVLSRVIKLYSNTASSVVCEQSNTRLPKKIFTISDLSAIQNSFDKKCNNSEQNGEGQSHHSVLKCFMVAGLVGINQTKSKDDELEQGGEEKIIHMIKLAKLSQERKEFKKAEQFLHLALRTAHELQHHEAQKYIIDDMANNAYEAGDFKKAEKLFINMLKQLLEDGMQPSENAIIHISAKLANLYASFGDMVKANEGYLFCLDHLNTKVSKGVSDYDTLALYTLVLSWFGEFIYSKEDYAQALGLFEQALKISVRVNGEHHPHSLLQLNNMAAAYTLMNRLDDAVKCLEKVMALAQEHELDDGLNDLPFYYINITNVLLTQVEKDSPDSSELLKMAEDACQEGLKSAKRAHNREALFQAKKSWEKVKYYKNLRDSSS